MCSPTPFSYEITSEELLSLDSMTFNPAIKHSENWVVTQLKLSSYTSKVK